MAASEHLSLNSAADRISQILGTPPKSEAQPPKPEVQQTKNEQVKAKAPEREDTDLMETPDETPTEEEAQDAPQQEAEEQEVEPPPVKELGDESETEVAEIELEPFQLAKILGVKEDDIVVTNNGELYFRTKIDGKEREASFEELRDSHQLSRTHYERLHKLSEERKAFENERKSALETMANQAQQMQSAITQLEQDYAGDFNQVDWNRLREEDPTEYNLKRNDYEDRRRKLNEYKQLLQQQQHQVYEQAERHRQTLQMEGSRQLEDVFKGEAYKLAPAWNEEEKLRLSHWIESQGFTQDDINSVTVWQIMKWARDSMLRENELKQARQTMKRVVRLPKVTKPGTQKTKRDIVKSEVEKYKVMQRKNRGNLQSTTDLISKILRG